MKVQILTGDALELLRGMEAESIDCCVTSPLYYGLRDYDTGTWEGGDASCQHIVGEMRRGLGLASSVVSVRGGGHKAAEVADIKAKALCPHCGAVRVDRQIGLEETPAAFVARLVEVFREVRRVLKKEGTCWLNLGDSYAGSWGAQSRDTNNGKHAYAGVSATSANQVRAAQKTTRTGSIREKGLKPKDLMGIPWRVAFALQDDGWFLRQDIIWHKPNPMPESVKDRCTKAHEYMFLLTKSARYYFDAEAIEEPCSDNTHARLSQDVQAQIGSERANGGTRADRPMKAVGKNSAQNVDRVPVSRKMSAEGVGVKNNGSMNAALAIMPETRNKRSVWTVASEAYKEAHFATFPPKLIEPCILAGCPEGGTVLDPFGGSGTTAMVANRNQRNAVLVELNPKYVAMARRRILDDGGMLVRMAAE